MNPNEKQFDNVVNLDWYRARKEGMSAPGPNHPAFKALQRKADMKQNLEKVEKETPLFDWSKE